MPLDAYNIGQDNRSASKFLQIACAHVLLNFNSSVSAMVPILTMGGVIETNSMGSIMLLDITSASLLVFLTFSISFT